MKTLDSRVEEQVFAAEAEKERLDSTTEFSDFDSASVALNKTSWQFSFGNSTELQFEGE